MRRSLRDPTNESRMAGEREKSGEKQQDRMREYWEIWAVFGRESAKEEHIVLIGLLQKACSLMGPV